MRRLAITIVFGVLCACSKQEPATGDSPVLPRLDAERVSVSGVSAGGYMAGQFHVAHSALIDAAGLIAAGPYWCAKGDIRRALDVCMRGGDFDYDRLAHFARDEAAAGRIDTLNYLREDRVWLFHGTRDAAVAADVVHTAALFYEDFVGSESVLVVDDVAAAHGMPTLSAGASCGEFADPWINACDYDAAGAMLAHILDADLERTVGPGVLQAFDQRPFPATGLADEGFIYIPDSCRTDGACGLHVALHGCRQGAEFVGDAFARQAGYNEWAEAHRLVVLYPQIESSQVAPMNPLGCWDWWGYSGAEYATQNGVQIRALKNMVDALIEPAA